MLGELKVDAIFYILWFSVGLLIILPMISDLVRAWLVTKGEPIMTVSFLENVVRTF